jgi:nitroreductase
MPSHIPCIDLIDLTMPISAEDFFALIRQRRSVRDFLPRPIPADVLDAVLADANWAPSWSPKWSSTQPYRIAIASGDLRDKLARALTARFDAGMRALAGGAFGKLKAFITREGMPNGDVRVDFEYPKDLVPRRRATGFGLYKLLGIARDDHAARSAQMRATFHSSARQRRSLCLFIAACMSIRYLMRECFCRVLCWQPKRAAWPPVRKARHLNGLLTLEKPHHSGCFPLMP